MLPWPGMTEADLQLVARFALGLATIAVALRLAWLACGLVDEPGED